MTNNTAKFSVSVHLSNTNINYSVDPLPDVETKDNDHRVLEWVYDTRKILTVTFDVQKLDPGDFVKLEQVSLDGKELHNSDIYCCYVEHGSNRVIDHTYHYLSHAGKYQIKIRYAPAVHRYMTYLLSLCKTNKSKVL